MNDDKDALHEAIKLQTEKIFAEIESAGSMIVAAQSGARANGFVLGLICAFGITADQGAVLADRFDNATEKRLRIFSLGLT